MNKSSWRPITDEVTLRALYEREVMSQREIAARYGMSIKAVQTAMRRFGIAPRPQIKRNQWGANNSSWKGKRAKYKALHLRKTVESGQPRLCESCGSTTATRYEWASMSGRYDDPKDYKRLCKSCHAKLDKIIRNLRARA